MIQFSERKSGREGLRRWIDDLGGPDRAARRRARQSLIQEGKAAVPELVKVLVGGNEGARLEAAKALTALKDPAAAPALIQALQDDDFGVRWNAMDGLIALERAGLPALLQALQENIESVRLREGARRVLRVFKDRKLLDDPVLKVQEALEDIEPESRVPWAAQAAADWLAHTR